MGLIVAYFIIGLIVAWLSVLFWFIIPDFKGIMDEFSMPVRTAYIIFYILLWPISLIIGVICVVLEAKGLI